MNFRFVILGILVIAIGAVILVFPETLATSPPGGGQTLLVRIAPDNYSYVRETVAPQRTLQVSFGSSAQGVDFFLMNSSSFSDWTSSPTQTGGVYPQSKLNVKNYTFTVTGTGTAAFDYYLVFISRTSGTSTDVLLHVVGGQQADITETLGVPLAFIGVGAIIVAFGATRKKPPVKNPEEDSR